MAVALGALGLGAAHAQLPALPQYVTISPKPEIVKLSLFVDYGGGSGAIAGRHFVGAQVLFDTPSRSYASVGAGALLFSDARIATAPGVAAALGHEFPREPSLLVVLAQTGIGYVSFGDSAGSRHHQLDIPIAFGFGVYGPVPQLSGSKLFSNATVKPWIAARAQLRHVSVTGSPAAVAGWRVGVGAALGLSIVLHRGWGVRVAYDRLWIKDPSTSRTRAEAAFGLGLVRVHSL